MLRGHPHVLSSEVGPVGAAFIDGPIGCVYHDSLATNRHAVDPVCAAGFLNERCRLREGGHGCPFRKTTERVSRSTANLFTPSAFRTLSRGRYIASSITRTQR